MKKTKKLLGAFLAVLMLLSVFSVTGFAIDFGTAAPAIESVVFTDSNPISKMEVKAYFDEYLAYVEEMKDLFGDEFVEDELVAFDLVSSNVEYTMEVTFTDGTKKSITNNDFYVTYNDEDVPVAWIDAYVTYDDYLAAVEGKKKEITVTIVGESFSDIFSETEPVIFTAQKKFVSKIVESIEIVSGIPSKIYEYADYYTFDDAVFKVKYNGKDAKNYTLKTSFDEDQNPVYTIDGKEIYIGTTDNVLYFDFLDATCEKKVKYKAEPFKDIEILDAAFDEETLTVSSVTYKITYTDGRSKTFTYTAPENMEYTMFNVINKVRGFFVYMDFEIFAVDYDEMTIDLETINVNVSVGYDNEVEDKFELDNPYAEQLLPYADIINFIFKVVSKLMEIIDNITSIFYM